VLGVVVPFVLGANVGFGVVLGVVGAAFRVGSGVGSRLFSVEPGAPEGTLGV
jgi:hypothetical protein